MNRDQALVALKPYAEDYRAVREKRGVRLAVQHARGGFGDESGRAESLAVRADFHRVNALGKFGESGFRAVVERPTDHK